MTLDEIFPQAKFPLRARLTETISKNGLSMTLTTAGYLQRPMPVDQATGISTQLEFEGRVVWEIAGLVENGQVKYFVKKMNDWVEVSRSEIEKQEQDLVGQISRQSTKFTEELVREVMDALVISSENSTTHWQTF